MQKKMIIGGCVVAIAAVLALAGIMILTYCSTMLQSPVETRSDIMHGTLINQTIPAHNVSLEFQNTDWIEYFIINAQVPDTPRFVPLYKGVLSDDDLARHFKYRAPNRYTVKNSTPSKAEAPALAEKALEAYGGLPEDAVLSSVYISESITQNGEEIIQREPVITQVFYKREINGMPVVGERDEISLGLGENGELLVLMKRWRTLESTGESVPVITPEAAVEKLKRGETYTKLQSPNNVLIDKLRLGYYEKPGKIREIILEPVWIFSNQNIPEFEFPVYARQFASFTETRGSGKDGLTVTFTDTSDASPTRWLWDFGDGTTSTEQNPIHSFKAAGTYDVTLTAWNDLGSDTVSEQYNLGVPP